MEKVPNLTSDKLIDVQRALEVIWHLLFSGSRGLKSIPLASESDIRNYNDALHEVQGVIPSEWFQIATAKWVELALTRWEEWLSGLDKFPQGCHYNDFRVDHMSLSMIGNRIGAHYLGSENNKLMDRLLDFLIKLHDLPPSNDPHAQKASQEIIRQWMGSLINRRSNCSRPGDPHRDETLRDFLRKKYRLG